jgi:hypothetical protein
MNGISYGNNSILSLGDFNSYFRVGEYLYDPSDRNSCYLFKSLSKKEMKKHLMKHFSKEEVIDMLLAFVDNGSDYQDMTA